MYVYTRDKREEEFVGEKKSRRRVYRSSWAIAIKLFYKLLSVCFLSLYIYIYSCITAFEPPIEKVMLAKLEQRVLGQQSKQTTRRASHENGHVRRDDLQEITSLTTHTRRKAIDFHKRSNKNKKKADTTRDNAFSCRLFRCCPFIIYFLPVFFLFFCFFVFCFFSLSLYCLLRYKL